MKEQWKIKKNNEMSEILEYVLFLSNNSIVDQIWRISKNIWKWWWDIKITMILMTNCQEFKKHLFRTSLLKSEGIKL